MRVAVTGAFGFLGWHVSCRLRALHDTTPIRLGRDALADDRVLQEALAMSDVVLHLAGVNRADSDDAVEHGNVDLASRVANAIVAEGRPIRVVFANSIQSEFDNPYGRGKSAAAGVLRDATASVGGSMADVLLPNLFGERGKPHYNSFVATFCQQIADGDAPTVTDDKEVRLLHAQAAAEVLIDAAKRTEDEQGRPAGHPRMVSNVRDQLLEFHALYMRGEIPSLTDAFSVDLFNTYRSYTFPQLFPLHPQVHADPRGELFETVRSHGGTGQTFVSMTRPGFTRGDHYHLHKVERFFVVHGQAEIKLRRLFDDEVFTFRLDGSRPGFVDMPTMWVHNISNVGKGDLVTMFWADQLLDPVNPDQFPERVMEEHSA